MAEEIDLKSIKCQFESDQAYMITYICFMLLYTCAVVMMMSDDRVSDRDVAISLFLIPVWPIGLGYSISRIFKRG